MKIIEDIVIKDFKDFSCGTGRKKEYMGDLIVAKARCLKGCNLLFTDLVPKLCMSQDPEYGTIKVMFKKSYYGEYKISIGDMENFNTLIIVGLGKEKSVINKLFAIPEKELRGKKFITITSTTVTYQKFEIDKKPYVQTYEDIKAGKCPILEDGSIV
jgi:hypothetical protein